MWMRGWLQESVSFGPRCVDGTFLRDSRLTRQQCSSAELASEPVAPGCEAELLTAPGPYGVSQIFSPFMNLKKEEPLKKKSGGKNNVAPSPEESDYFYDEYVDYPYNESITIRNKPEFTTIKPGYQTTKSSHYVPGDTPTIYAATKNKTKTPNNTTKEITKSPGSSGFTFFGVPLPNLNLNSLLGGSGRKEDHKPSEAERKAGIVTTTRGSGRGSMFPPTIPEIQTGGFVPVIPGTGGFKPINNPTLDVPPRGNVSVDIEVVNVTYSRPQSNTTEATNVSPSTPSHSTNTYIMRKTSFSSMGHPMPTPPPEVRPTTEYSAKDSSIQVPSSTEPIRANVLQETVKEVPGVSKIAPNTNLDSKILNELPKPVNITNYHHNMSKLHLNGFKNSEAYANTFKQYTGNISHPTTVKSEEATLLKQKNEEPTAVLTSNENNREEITEEPKKENSATPLTSLLVPGGQQPNYRPPGRSIITKVVSPHTSATAPLLSSMQVSDDVLPSPYKEEIITEGTMQNMEKDESDTSWYFMNYNKTNLEPYIGSVFSKSYNIFVNFSKAGLILMFVCTYVLN